MPRVDTIGNDLDAGGVFVVKQAIVGSGWCCAPKGMTLEEVQKAVDERCEPYLPGTPWTVTSRVHEDKELVSPGLCAECPDTREHWFMLGGGTGVLMMAMLGAEGIPEDLMVRMSFNEEDGNEEVVTES